MMILSTVSYSQTINLSASVTVIDENQQAEITATLNAPVSQDVIIDFNLSGSAIEEYDFSTNFTVKGIGVTVAGGIVGGNAANQLDDPWGVFVDLEGNIYVADNWNDRVQKWAPGATEGITVATGILSSRDVFVDLEGNIFVPDNPADAVIKFAPGDTVGVIVAGGNGRNGNAANQLNAPWGVFVDLEGNIYVADYLNDRVQKWAPGATEGITVAGGNGSGNAANQLYRPSGVFVDLEGNIYVADYSNHRVQKWAPGATEGITVAGGNGSGNAANQFSRPRDVHLDLEGNIYVADYLNDRVQKWLHGATEGITVAGGNGDGNAANQFSRPIDVHLDLEGNIYVADNDNNRIQKFQTKPQIVIPAGQTTGTFTINGIEDTLDEPDEIITITPTTVTNGTLTDNTPIEITITDTTDSPLIILELSAEEITENAIEDVTLTASLSTVSGFDVELTFSTSGTADESQEYTLSTYTITIPAGEESGSLFISTNGLDDTTAEIMETIIINAETITNATAETNSVTLKLVSDDVPVAVADTATVLEDSETTNIDVITNDTDEQDGTLILTAVSTPETGTVALNADGLSVDYTPEADFNGTEILTYTVSDGILTDETGTLTITVTPVNDAPVSVNDIIELNEGGLITVLQNNELTLLHNDSDIDEDDLSTFIVDSPLYGELELNLDGTFSYQHEGSETTSDSFTYKSNDGVLDSNISTVTIIINPVNDNSPSNISISNNSIEENISNATVGQLSTTDLDLPSDSHSFELISGEGDNDNNKFSIDGSNLNLITSLDYESEPNHSIRIRVKDENDNSYEDSITINVVDINDISITTEITESYCSDNSGTGSITITSINNVSGPSSFSWSSENGGIIPSGQENSQNLSDLTSGTYILNLSNNGFNFTQQFEVGLTALYELTICYVSSDEVNSSNNRIFLNNIGNYNVDYYEILRETNITDNYESIGQIQSSENSFLDESSNNTSQSYTYKVRSIDYCGVSSSTSDKHKTILLQSSVAINNTVNLNWSEYDGTNYQSYDIYRNKNDEGFELLESVSINNNTFTDSTADISQNSYIYYISITVDDCLTQTRGSSEIKSNLQNIGSSLTTGEDVSSKWLSIYPNPSSDIVYIDGNYTQLKVVVYDILGKQVMKESITNSIDISQLEKGVYILQLSDGAKVSTQRIIKN